MCLLPSVSVAYKHIIRPKPEGRRRMNKYILNGGESMEVQLRTKVKLDEVPRDWRGEPVVLGQEVARMMGFNKVDEIEGKPGLYAPKRTRILDVNEC